VPSPTAGSDTAKTRTATIQTSDHIENIATARHRLQILFIGRTVTNLDRAAIRAILDELHRLHLAVSEQRKTLQSIAKRKNKTSRKPAAAPSQRPTAHGTRQNKERHGP
jgi:hypothetical protein